jgi:hypothetical protein
VVSLPILSLEKARLEVVAGYPDVPSLEFKYNPETFSLSKSAEWSEPPQQQSTDDPAPPTHQRTNAGTLSMEIFFDAFEELDGDITDDVTTLFDWTMPCDTDDDDVRNPPLLAFKWGSSRALQGFQGYLQSVSVHYTLFRRNGTPIRATCNITLVEVPDTPTGTNPSSGGRSGYRTHLLIEGETLHSVAWSEYHRADLWRAIAAANDIDDPMRVPPGTRLLLPPHRDAARLA